MAGRRDAKASVSLHEVKRNRLAYTCASIWAPKCSMIRTVNLACQDRTSEMTMIIPAGFIFLLLQSNSTPSEKEQHEDVLMSVWP